MDLHSWITAYNHTYKYFDGVTRRLQEIDRSFLKRYNQIGNMYIIGINISKEDDFNENY